MLVSVDSYFNLIQQEEWNRFWKSQHDSLSGVTMVGGAEVNKIIEVSGKVVLPNP